MACPQCFSGHINPGEPLGRLENVFGRETYISEPPNGKEPRGIIVIIPDAFGLPFVNNKILADHYAAAGQYLVYLPDFLDGQPAAVQTMINMAHLWDEKTSWLATPYYLFAVCIDFIPFMYRNRVSQRWPGIKNFLSALREDKGAKLPVGVAGFCWGGYHSVQLAHDNAETRTSQGRPLVDAVFAAHMSNLSVPQDFDKIQRNISIAIGDKDAVMKFSDVEKARAILEGKTDVDTEVVIYPGAGHGFAVRASRAVPDSKETQQAEQAEKQAIAWFQKQFARVTQN